MCILGDEKSINSPSRDRHEARDASIVAFAYDVDPIHPKKKEEKKGKVNGVYTGVV